MGRETKGDTARLRCNLRGTDVERNDSDTCRVSPHRSINRSCLSRKVSIGQRIQTCSNQRRAAPYLEMCSLGPGAQGCSRPEVKCNAGHRPHEVAWVPSSRIPARPRNKKRRGRDDPSPDYEASMCLASPRQSANGKPAIRQRTPLTSLSPQASDTNRVAGRLMAPASHQQVPADGHKASSQHGRGRPTRCPARRPRRPPEN